MNAGPPRVEQARSRVKLALTSEREPVRSSSGPRQKLEPPSVATALPNSASSFHFSKYDSLLPPEPLNLLAALFPKKQFPSPTSKGWL
jgi:hypothetical protein